MATATPDRAAKPARSRSRRALLWTEYRDGYLFILPWLIGFVIWVAIPMLASAYIALTDWEIVTPARFVGLAEFGKLLADDRFYLSLYNTAYYVVLGVPTHVALALLSALALNAGLRGIGIFRTLYYLPSVTPAVASAMLWAWLFNAEFGLFNMALQAVGLPGVLWLQDPAWSKPAFIIMSYWSLGAQMVILLAGLQSVPQHLYEAAAIDGCGRFNRFRHVTLPLLTPSLFFTIIVGFIGAFQVFTTAYIMTSGGPQNSTLFYVLYLYRMAFENFQMGYASALAWILFVVILALTLLQFRLANRWVFYEGEVRS
ncbi:MAG TPA: sugar ABC transporter permease [Chloroflexota bacterium]|nr:sugar ABC transporter permease [Chloroflexota bacterium]